MLIRRLLARASSVVVFGEPNLLLSKTQGTGPLGDRADLSVSQCGKDADAAAVVVRVVSRESGLLATSSMFCVATLLKAHFNRNTCSREGLAAGDCHVE